jgi:hypothetical protein
VTARQELETFFAKYDVGVVRTARAALRRLRQQFPGATLLVYDNYNALVIGFAPSERASEAVLSIALYPRWVTLFFLQGAALPDPHKRLQGSGKIVRSVRLDQIEILDEPAVRELIEVAARGSGMEAGKGKLVIRSISKVQRPRRPPRPPLR